MNEAKGEHAAKAFYSVSAKSACHYGHAPRAGAMLQAREAFDKLPWASSTTDNPWRFRLLALALAISLLANTLLVTRLGTIVAASGRGHDSRLTYCEFPAPKIRSRSCRQV